MSKLRNLDHDADLLINDTLFSPFDTLGALEQPPMNLTDSNQKGV